MRKSKTCEYFLASRLFEMAELKILIDSVQSSHYITKRKSELLIKKLKGLVAKRRQEISPDKFASMTE